MNPKFAIGKALYVGNGNASYMVGFCHFELLASPRTKSVGISMASFPAAFLQEIQFHAFPIDCLYFYRPVRVGSARGTIALPDFDI